MVRIRLQRTGRKNAPAYRVVVVDSKKKQSSEVIEIIGNYNPTEDPKKVTIKQDRFDYWKSKGAQPTGAVVQLLAGTYDYKKYDPKGDAMRAEEAEKAEAEAKKVAEKPATPEATDDTSAQESPAEPTQTPEESTAETSPQESVREELSAESAPEPETATETAPEPASEEPKE